MDKPKLSIIVPVYNAETYIVQCIESILQQNIESIEVLLIDDGSDDESGKLCDAYADRHGQIRVIHQENRGLLASRKRGVELAEGEYVTLVDSDDWIEGPLFAELLHTAGKSREIDMVISGLTCEKGNLKFRKSGSISPGIYEVVKDSIPERMLYDWTTGEMGIAGYACGKLFRRKLLAEALSCVEEKLVHGEDFAWVFSYVPSAEKIAVIDCFYYHYRMHPDSMSASFDMESFRQLLTLKNHFSRQMQKGKINKENVPGVNQLVWGGLMHALREVYGLSVGYIFPYELVKVGSKVVIYGAGVVGRCYYNCLKSGSYAEVAALVDKNWSGMTDTAYEVCPPDRILEVPYDVVIIAVEPEELYRNIRAELKELGVEDEKIIWKKPRILRT